MLFRSQEKTKKKGNTESYKFYTEVVSVLNDPSEDNFGVNSNYRELYQKYVGPLNEEVEQEDQVDPEDQTPVTQKGNYECHECNEKFNSKAELTKHENKKHE